VKLKYLAMKYVDSYLRSLYNGSTAVKIDIHTLPLEEFSTRLGLMETPNLSFIKSDSPEVEEESEKESESGSDEDDSSDNDSSDHDSSEDEEDDDTDMLLKEKKTKKKKIEKITSKKNIVIFSDAYKKM
jgi:hypothetical protein